VCRSINGDFNFEVRVSLTVLKIILKIWFCNLKKTTPTNSFQQFTSKKIQKTDPKILVTVHVMHSAAAAVVTAS